jgi:hypothetical protein
MFSDGYRTVSLAHDQYYVTISTASSLLCLATPAESFHPRQAVEHIVDRREPFHPHVRIHPES